MAQQPRVRNALHNAVLSVDRNWREVYRVMNAHPELISQQDNHNKTPLHYASERAPGFICLKMMQLTDDATLDLLYLPAGPCILHEFSRRGRTECITHIVGRTRERINHINLDNQTPLHWCAEANLTFELHRDIINLLLQSGADPLLNDRDGNNAGELYFNNPCGRYDNPQEQIPIIQQLIPLHK